MNSVTLEQIVSLCKRRGFVYPTSEIYGGLVSSYDYGPMGVELLNNIKKLWWREFIQKREDMVGIDSQILLNPQTWVASGHVTSFADPMVEDVVTHKRYRADHLIEEWIQSKLSQEFKSLVIEEMDISEMGALIKKHKIKSPEGNGVGEPKKFNLLFETKLGVVEEHKSKLYVRGETAQGIFTNFKNILDSTRVKLPFGVGQIGKSFRNEITTGQFVFRTLEFEQAEIEYFFDPESSNWEGLFDEWKKSMWKFVTETLGIDKNNLRWRRHTDTERSHYSKETYDLDYKFPFGWKELWGLSYRTDFDLSQHEKLSGKSLRYNDPQTGKSFVPHVIEPAVGINRLFLMVLCDFYQDDGRTRLSFPQVLAPHTVAVFPLLANKPELVEKARDVYEKLLDSNIAASWDARGNIGKRYMAQDEIGTPWCITIDYDSMKDDTVTLRSRDTTKQERVKIAKLKSKLVQNNK